MEIITEIARAAVALLIAVLAIYLSVRLLGKLAKFIITLVVIAFVLWLIFADSSFLSNMIADLGWVQKLQAWWPF